jgi:hypothetical protein
MTTGQSPLLRNLQAVKGNGINSRFTGRAQ